MLFLKYHAPLQPLPVSSVTFSAPRPLALGSLSLQKQIRPFESTSFFIDVEAADEYQDHGLLCLLAIPFRLPVSLRSSYTRL